MILPWVIRDDIRLRQTFIKVKCKMIMTFYLSKLKLIHRQNSLKIAITLTIKEVQDWKNRVIKGIANTIIKNIETLSLILVIIRSLGLRPLLVDFSATILKYLQIRMILPTKIIKTNQSNRTLKHRMQLPIQQLSWTMPYPITVSLLTKMYLRTRRTVQEVTSSSNNTRSIRLSRTNKIIFKDSLLLQLALHAIISIPKKA